MFDNNVLEDIQTNWRTFVRKAGSAEFLIIVRDFFVLFLGTSSGSLAKLTISILFAAMIGFLNVVFWVIVVFSSAAPMILSGLYEATIDRQVIRGIEKAELDSQFNAKKNRESRKEPGTDEHPILQTQPTKDGNDSIQRVEHPTETPPADVTEEKEVSYQIHLLYAVLVGNLKLGPITGKTDKTNETHSIPKHRAWYDVKNLVNDLTPTNMESARRTKTRLTTMLGCQASFGASIGAPVAFYLGSFLFSVFGNRSKLGDSDISLALAFGEWWMIVPHVAIVSGCLLAGNNPNTLEAIVSGLDHKDDPSNDMSKTEKSTAEKFYWSAFYQSVYQPVWMWERGRNKRNWIKKVQDDYPHEKGNEKTDDNWARHLWKEYLTSTPLQEVPYVGTVAGGFLVLTLSVLIIVPFVLAYVTSFYTPTIGLSCRTFTFVLYFVFQALLAIVWFWDFLTEDGHSPLSQKTTKQWIIYCLATLFFIGSAFTAIIGTFMQIVGVYRNCLCSIPMGYWGSRSYHFTISSNSREGIYYASLYWVSTAIASICLLLIFCYFGWWYQRHWRNRFNNIVKRVLNSEKAEAEVSADGGSVSKPTATQEVVEEK